MNPSSDPERFPRRPVTLLHADIVGFMGLSESMDDATMATLLDDFYERAHRAVAEQGGEVTKYLGDAVLAYFDGVDAVPAAVAAFQALEADMGARFRAAGGRSSLRGCVHVGEVVVARLGPLGRTDLVGADVVDLFRLASHRGLALSEKAYRRLPSGARSPFRKRTTPAVYLA